MIEVLEKALESYKRDNSELEKYRKIIPPKIKPQPKLIPYYHINFICDSCGDEYESDTAYSYARSLGELKQYATYCVNCVK